MSHWHAKVLKHVGQFFFNYVLEFRAENCGNQDEKYEIEYYPQHTWLRSKANIVRRLPKSVSYVQIFVDTFFWAQKFRTASTKKQSHGTQKYVWTIVTFERDFDQKRKKYNKSPPNPKILKLRPEENSDNREQKKIEAKNISMPWNKHF